ncbi:small nuclear ribonucleoprotein G-like [Crocuta crocuta]
MATDYDGIMVGVKRKPESQESFQRTLSKAHPPKVKKFMHKKLSLKLNGGSHVQGLVQGLDPFMNLVTDECVGMAISGQQDNNGMVVLGANRINMEALKRVLKLLYENILAVSLLSFPKGPGGVSQDLNAVSKLGESTTV